jgi:hypothetical protein
MDSDYFEFAYHRLKTLSCVRNNHQELSTHNNQLTNKWSTYAYASMFIGCRNEIQY